MRVSHEILGIVSRETQIFKNDTLFRAAELRSRPENVPPSYFINL
jgi:hypothetical protein